jgi:hypothetical protein
VREQLDEPTLQALLHEGRTIGFDDAVEKELKAASTAVSRQIHHTNDESGSPHS